MDTIIEANDISTTLEMTEEFGEVDSGGGTREEDNIRVSLSNVTGASGNYGKRSSKERYGRKKR
jgi:hypothetical protein